MQARGSWSAGQGDDTERFLADLRALRDTAGLEYDELSARAHYPSDIIKEAENGPSLPGLPVLAAYVRACDGDVPEWEERWRRLGFKAQADPGLPVRPAGASPAAAAGARAGVSIAPPDVYDPERIRAALRGRPGHAKRAVLKQETSRDAVPGWDGSTSRNGGPDWAAERRWDTSAGRDATTGQDGPPPDLNYHTGHPGEMPSDGNHHAGYPGETPSDRDHHAGYPGETPSDRDHHAGYPGETPSGPVTERPDAAAESAEAIRRDPFSAAWLHDAELPPPPDPESARPDRADTGSAPASADTWFTPAQPSGHQGAGPAVPAQAQPRPAVPQPQPTPAVPAQAQPTPAVPPPSGHQGAGPAVLAQAQATPAVPQPQAQPRLAAPPPAAAPPGQSRSDRLFPLRLLVVILVAALIGSVLVLLIS